MEKDTIITLRNQGKSLREIARITGFSRNTVRIYWRDYLEQIARLDIEEERHSAQEAIYATPRYDISSRKPTKYTPEIDAAVDTILAEEIKKCRVLGVTNKQGLSCLQIHALIKSQGFDIGLTTITKHVSEKRKRAKEAFIRQEYDLGDRLEYDFGEVRIVIKGVMATYHIAAMCSPAAGFRWAYLYEDQSKDSFSDSHVRFFEMSGGVYREVVYDNMRNVVSRFIGRNEKELNDDLVKMSLYYGFTINVTNCFAGNEKGYVESAVKFIRNKVFAVRYAFDSLEEAKVYLAARLADLNAGSAVDEERACLLPYRPPLEIAKISEQIVDKYSFIRVGNNFYSVPDYLVGRRLTVKVYPSEIIVFSGMSEVASHPRMRGYQLYSVDIFHYLDTLARKPGALKNSVALRSQDKLKDLYEQHYSQRPREFIALLKENSDHSIDEMASIICAAVADTTAFCSRPAETIAENVRRNTQSQLVAASAAFLKGGERVAC